MQVPLQLTFRNMDRSDAVEAEIAKRINKLEKHFRDIISCRVVVEAPPQHLLKGGLFKVGIDISCPDAQVEINRTPPAEHEAHQDVYVAIRDAFTAAERQLEEHINRQKGKVKHHQQQQ